MSALVTVAVADRVMEITLSRPEKKNALVHEMYAIMADALRAGEADPGVRVTLITGSGGSFTAGNDLKDFASSPPVEGTAPVHRFLENLAGAEKLLVAAVNGPAVGVGTTLLLHCDLVVAGTDARFQLPFVNLALVPEAAASLLLPRLVGHQRAMELLILGEPLEAAEAHRLGLVNLLVAPEAVLETARDLARRAAAKAPEAVRLTKRLVRGDLDQIRTRMSAEGAVFRERLTSPELKEAVAAFFEKRAPDFDRLAG